MIGILLIRPLEESYHRLPSNEITPADGAIVLGGMLNFASFWEKGKNGRGVAEFNSAVDRILSAEKLLYQKKIRQLVITGALISFGRKKKSESSILQSWLIQRGNPPKSILIEENARNTAENAAFTAQIIQEKGWKRVYLITSAFHMPRSILCFQKKGSDLIAMPTDFRIPHHLSWVEYIFPSLEGITLSSISLREYAALLIYRISGKI